jgi:hypothetical protein
VPAQRGPAEKVTVGAAALLCADVQQIWPGQSALLPQLLGQLVRHRPLQQISPDELLHSALCVQVLGHRLGLVVGFRHRPVTPSPGSALATVVQHTSFWVTSHSLVAVHALGHFEAGRQMLGL